MEKVTLDEIMGPERYEHIREDFRRQIIALKKTRRVPVGEHITFVFENHETVFFQIQEMLRVERITDLDKVRFEVNLGPADGAGLMFSSELLRVAASVKRNPGA